GTGAPAGENGCTRRAEGRRIGLVGSKFGLRLSNILVACQMALCVVLLAAAGLMIRSAVKVYSAPIGVNTANVLTMRLNLPEAKYAKSESWTAFHQNLSARLKALPGVELAGVASNLPLGGWVPLPFEFEGRTIDPAQPPEGGGLVVSNNYFQTMQVQPRRGRLFLDADGVAGPPVVVYEVRTLESRIAESRLTVSLFGAICSIFAVVATVLAAIGLYGVIAHAVSRRTQEIGLRMAIGASRRDIVRLVLAQGIRPLVPGLAVGLLLALAASRLLRVALVGVSPNDPATFVGIVIVLTSAVALGCIVPARRASRIDPLIALRYE